MITYCLTVFPLTPNTWLWLTLNPDFVLNCVLRQHVWSSDAWLSKHGWSYTCKECCWRTSTEKNTCSIARFGNTAFLFYDTPVWPTDGRVIRAIASNAVARKNLSSLNLTFVSEYDLFIVSLLITCIPAEEIVFEIGYFSKFRTSVTLTLTLDRVIRHTDMCHLCLRTKSRSNRENFYERTDAHWDRLH